MIENSVNYGELVIDHPSADDPIDQFKVVEDIIQSVSKDSATDAIKRMNALNKQISTSVRRNSETIISFTEGFSALAQSYIKVLHSDRSSTESQNFSMKMLTNANIPTTMFSVVFNNLVMTAKSSNKMRTSMLPIS